MKAAIEGTRLIFDDETGETYIDNSIAPHACDGCHQQRHTQQEQGMWLCAVCLPKNRRRNELYHVPEDRLTTDEWRELHALDLYFGY